MNTDIAKKIIRYAFGILQIFVGITAVLGGFGLVADPTGTKMKIPLEALQNSPFPNYLIPGLVLLLVIGVGHVMAGVITFLRHRWTGNLAIYLGAFLSLYLIIEVWFIGLVNFSQPLYFVIGAVELIFGLKMSRSAKTDSEIWIPSTGNKLKA